MPRVNLTADSFGVCLFVTPNFCLTPPKIWTRPGHDAASDGASARARCARATAAEEGERAGVFRVITHDCNTERWCSLKFLSERGLVVQLRRLRLRARSRPAPVLFPLARAWFCFD